MWTQATNFECSLRLSGSGTSGPMAALRHGGDAVEVLPECERQEVPLSHASGGSEEAMAVEYDLAAPANIPGDFAADRKAAAEAAARASVRRPMVMRSTALTEGLRPDAEETGQFTP